MQGLDQGPKPKRSRRLLGGVIVVVVVVALAVVGSFQYLKTAMKPVNTSSHTRIEVKIPNGSTSKQIGKILASKKVIRSGMAFNYYLRRNNKSNLKAGYYEFTPAMTLDQITRKLQQGGANHPLNGNKVLVREGANIDSIAEVVAANTKFTQKEFIAAVTNKGLIDQLAQQYPDLLGSAVKAKDVRYVLEGYLYPATYAVTKKTTLNELIAQMVAKTNEVLAPYYQQIKDKKLTVQELLSLAALVEREGGAGKQDNERVAGVFLNRIDAGMPLQSDVAIQYALKTTKKNITYKDLKVNSPYNLYTNKGYGPGPIDNPSLRAVKAVLNPVDRDKKYLYFVANMKTGKVYFSKTYAEHQKITEKLAAANK